MSVTSYNPQLVCGYKYSKLKNVVYLVSKEHTKDVRIDNGEAYITNLAETPMRIDCTSVNFNETESLDERYKFSKTLKFTVDGYANVASLEGGCYAIIITYDGTPFMVNIDFPAKVTYTFTLSDKQNQTEFTLSLSSNYPTLKLQASLDSANMFKCKPYREYGIKQLQLIEKDYVTLNDQTAVVTTFGGHTFKEINFNKGTCQLQERYDGESCTNTITFDIAFDDYKPSWQYNLLEFTENLYAAMVTPRSSTNMFFVGFNFGLDPQYTIEGTTTVGEADKITITLSEKSVHGMYTLENPRIVDNDDTYWQYVENVFEWETYECIDNGVAKYLAMQELDSMNNPTGNYKVLRGYRERFEGKFNIIGEFDEVVTFYTTKCSWFNVCEFTGLPNVITYIGTTCKDFTVMGTCDWHFENMPNFLTYSRTTGAAGVSYDIRICNTLDTDTTVVDTFDVVYGDKKDTIDVQIITSDMKLQAYYRNQTRYQLPCDGVSALTRNEVIAWEQAPYTDMLEAIIGTCVDRVGYYAFSGCSRMVSVEIPNTVKYIDRYGFYGDSSLQHISLPNSLIEIGEYAFQCCSGATLLDLGNGVQRISGDAFSYCTSLPEIYIPDSVNYMGDYTFYANSGATSLRLSENSAMTKVPNYSFRYCKSLPSVVIPDNYTEVGSFAFADCSAMTSVTLSENLTTLKNSAFEYNPALPSIELPQSLRTIGSSCFRLCTSLSSVTIPSDVTSIGAYAFSGDTALQWVVCEPLVPPTGGSAMFDVTNDCPIYVHCVALPAYQVASYWSNYRKRLRSIEDDCPVKLHTEYTDSSEFDVYCNDSSTLTSSEATMGGSKSNITDAVVGTCVEVIGANAFYDADSLTAVTLPNTIKRIDNYAFYSDDILPSITLPCADYPPEPPSRLPAGYKEVGYLEATTNAYINTGIYLNTSNFEVGYTCVGSSAQWGYAHQNVDTGAWISVEGSYAYFGQWNTNNRVVISSYLSNVENTIVYTQNSVTVNGNRITKALNLTGVDNLNDSPLLFFAWYDFYRSGIQYFNTSKIKSFYIKNNGTLVRNYVPCIRESDNKAGMFDLVSNQFYVSPNGYNFTPKYNDKDGLVIGDYAFEYCKSFTSITFPDCLVKAGVYSFAYESKLRNINWGSGLTSISEGMFYYDTALSGVSIPSQISSIGSQAFKYCTALSGITIPNTVTDLGGMSFENCTSLQYATIGSGVSVIKGGTFRGDTALTSVTMTDNVVNIQEQAFQSCTSLSSITLSSNLTTIGSAAFRYDTALSSCTIPDKVTSMGSEIFNGCTRLQWIMCTPTTPPTLSSSNSFNNTNNCPIYVPCMSLAAYKSASQWSNVKERIFGYGEDCPVKYRHRYSDYGEFLNYCDDTTYMTSADTITRPNNYGHSYSSMTLSEIGECVVSISANTYSGCSLQSFTIVGESHLQKIGNSAFRNCTHLTSFDIPNTVNYLGTSGFCDDTSLTSITFSTNSSLTSIPNYTCRRCTSLPRVVIPSNYTSIGNYAFANNESLTSVTLSRTLTAITQSAFEYDRALPSITLPNSLKTLGGSAFRDCTSLSTVTIPSGVTSIGSNCFSGDTGIQYVICEPMTPPTLGNTDAFKSNVDYIIYVHCDALGSYQKANVWKSIKQRLRPIETPCEPKLHATYDNGSTNDVYCDGNTTLPQSDVRNDAPSYTMMRTADIGECVVYIGSDAFRDCVLLEDVDMHNTVTSIGSAAFRNCSTLSSFTMSNNVTSIGAEAFYECTSLSAITLPNTLTTIGNNAFHHCAAINQKVTVPNNVSSFGTGVFSNCYHIPSVELPNNLTSIPNGTFSACLALSAVTIPSTVKTIGNNAFEACIRLTGITIPNGVTKIGNNAFEDCEKLTSITIPASVTEIGSQAFYYCSGLTEIRMESEKPPVLSGESVFDFTNNCPIYVPCSAAYSQAKGWSEYAGRMIEYGGGCNIAMQAHYSDNTNFSSFCFELTGGKLTTTQTREHSTSYTAMTTANVGDCVTSIGDNAFDNCWSLTSITIPNTVTSVGQNSFRACKILENITLPNNLTTIGNYAFSACTSLTSITIPASVSTINQSAFRNCSGLTGIYPQSAVAPTLGSYAFDGSSCPIYLPTCDSYGSYYSKWSSYRSRLRLPADCPTGVTIDLNNQWSGSTSYGNLSSASTQYEFYESYSNWHIHNSSATTIITTTNVPLWFYVRSNAEGSWDYVLVFCDGTQRYTGSNKQSDSVWQMVNLSSYTGAGTHLIQVVYKKDGSVDAGTDRGYLAIPKTFLS